LELTHEGLYDLHTDGRLTINDLPHIEMVVMYFNLTTGQPATEADYKAFNQIVSL